MAQRFCNQCGSQLDSGGSCTNAGCANYSLPLSASAVETAVPPAPPAAPDLFADLPTGDVPRLSDDQVVPRAPTSDRDWIAAGDAGQNDVYVGNRLLYRDPETTLNGSPELKLLFMAATRWFVIGLLVFPAIFVVSIVFAFMAGPKTGLVLFFLLSVAFWVLFFVLPARIPISEWMLLLDDKGRAAESAFAQISDAFRRREAPAEPVARRVSFRGLRSVGRSASTAPPARNYLSVKYGYVVGYISAFPFGNDLFIGWTLWWQQRPIRSAWNLLRQLIAAVLGRDVQFQLTLRADDAKALRELMHSAGREGVDVATRGLTVSLAGTVGADVPVEAFQAAFAE